MSNVVSEAPITQAELIEMFGDGMPWEAWALLDKSPDEMTIGEMRSELRRMAREKASISARTMVERVAIAMFDKGEKWTTMGGQHWDTAPEVQKQVLRAQARAAIEALREPTEAMLATLSAKDKLWRDTNSTEVWQAFIDGALKE